MSEGKSDDHGSRDGGWVDRDGDRQSDVSAVDAVDAVSAVDEVVGGSQEGDGNWRMKVEGSWCWMGSEETMMT